MSLCSLFSLRGRSPSILCVFSSISYPLHCLPLCLPPSPPPPTLPLTLYLLLLPEFITFSLILLFLISSFHLPPPPLSSFHPRFSFFVSSFQYLPPSSPRVPTLNLPQLLRCLFISPRSAFPCTAFQTYSSPLYHLPNGSVINSLAAKSMELVQNNPLGSLSSVSASRLNGIIWVYMGMSTDFVLTPAFTFNSPCRRTRSSS